MRAVSAKTGPRRGNGENPVNKDRYCTMRRPVRSLIKQKTKQYVLNMKQFEQHQCTRGERWKQSGKVRPAACLAGMVFAHGRMKKAGFCPLFRLPLCLFVPCLFLCIPAVVSGVEGDCPPPTHRMPVHKSGAMSGFAGWDWLYPAFLSFCSIEIAKTYTINIFLQALFEK